VLELKTQYRKKKKKKNLQSFLQLLSLTTFSTALTSAESLTPSHYVGQALVFPENLPSTVLL
jgi:hypothetical protein